MTDFVYTATLAKPLFGMIGTMGGLLAALSSRLAPFGLRPADLRIENPWLQPSEITVIGNFFEVSATIRVKLTEMEVWTRNVQFALGPTSVPLIRAGLDALGEFGGGIAVSVQAFSLACHSTLESSDINTLIRSHISRDSPSDGSLPLVPFGVAYEVTVSPDARYTVDLQRSLQIQGDSGAFIRILGFFDGGRKSVEERREEYGDAVSAVLGQLGIELALQ